MAALLSEKTILPDEVRELLRAKSADSEFQITEELIKESFPEMLALDVYLQEDPDEEGITRVIIEATLPESTTYESLREQKIAYHNALAERLNNVELPVCGLSIQFA